MLEKIIKSVRKTLLAVGFCASAACGDTSIIVNNYFGGDDGGSSVREDSSAEIKKDDRTCIDDGVLNVFYADKDNDGFGDRNSAVASCSAPAGYVSNDDDCDDADALRWQNLLGYMDRDNDGYGAGAITQVCSGESLLEGYVNNSTDCNDEDNALWQYVAAHRDADGDGFGQEFAIACAGTTLPDNYILNDLDCDDTNASVNPTAEEICDGADNNCNDEIDDNLAAPSRACILGVGECIASGLEYQTCEGLGGWSPAYSGCDAIPREPGEEICNCLDNNCDGEIDCGDLEGRIAFTRRTDSGEGSVSEIYVRDANGCNVTNLTNYAVADNRSPAWSPDGTRIAFVSRRDGNNEIYVMEADGSGQTNLTNNTYFENGPVAWSPDGEKIAFYSSRSPDYTIFIMNSDGTDVARLTSHDNDYDPSWSPDGTKIAFTVRGTGEDYSSEVYNVNADGSERTNLTNYPGANDYEPSWSPDGSRIAFISGRDGNAEVYIMNPDGTEQMRLTETAGNEINPKWSPDGTKILFGRDSCRFYIMEIDGSSRRDISNSSSYSGCDSEHDWSL